MPNKSKSIGIKETLRVERTGKDGIETLMRLDRFGRTLINGEPSAEISKQLKEALDNGGCYNSGCSGTNSRGCYLPGNS
jgi:hypothetical protein